MISRRSIVVLTIFLTLNSCWKKQNIEIAGPEMPSYELYGRVNYEEENVTVAALDISLTQMEVYQGEYLAPMFSVTDSAGEYSFPSLFRGRYRLRLTQDGLVIYEKDVGLINFDDREYNIEIPRVIQLLERQISLQAGEEIRGLAEFSGAPLILTYFAGGEHLRHPDLDLDIMPDQGSYWMHSGLADRGIDQFSSIRRQVDTTIIDGNISISAPAYYLSTFDVNSGQTIAGGLSLGGEQQQLTHNADRTGFWNMYTNFVDQKFLYRSDIEGQFLNSNPLAGNQSGIFSVIENDTAFLAVDTSNSSIWVSSLSDSLYGTYNYKVFDTADSLVSVDGDIVKFLAVKNENHLFIANRSGVWTARILGR
ncbi:LysR family transcriptional regulator [bacterium]|nr:LysR family transcriptional regulator [bacterium]